MNAKYLFYVTLIISVIVQIITGIIEIFSLFIKVPKPYIIIKQLLILEIIVQIIEGLFYLWLVYNFTQVLDVTPKRYFDWSITTPTMLITLIFYLIYLKHKESGTTNTLNFFNLFIDNYNSIFYILILNWLMLIFGYLGEINLISNILGVTLGFIPFLMYYYYIYIKYATLSKTGWILFLYFFFFWSLYGIAALFPYYVKNTFYNILDLFSKNFFGIFLSYTILSKNY
jgi:hypothetical protein